MNQVIKAENLKKAAIDEATARETERRDADSGSEEEIS